MMQSQPIDLSGLNQQRFIPTHTACLSQLSTCHSHPKTLADRALPSGDEFQWRGKGTEQVVPWILRTSAQK